MPFGHAHATDIIAYTYRADTYCPACVISQLMAEGHAGPWAAERDAEEVLDIVANERGVHRYDEHSYDSNEFPKVVFRDMVNQFEHDHCGSCGEEIQ